MSQQAQGPTKFGPVQVAASIFTVIGGVAALLATDKPWLILGAGLAGVIAMFGLAVYSVHRHDKKAAGWFAVGTIVLAAVLAGYIAVVKPFEAPATVDGRPSQRSSSQPSSAATKSVSGPLVEGTVEIGIDQAVDIDVAGAKAEFARKLAPPYDLFINELTNPPDRNGYLLWFTEDPMRGREICNRLYESGKARQPNFTLPYTSYCVRTSEGRLATVTVTATNLSPYNNTSTAQLTYRVWE